MKVSLAFILALALTGAVNIAANPVRTSSELHQVLEEFLALVPKDKLVDILQEYVENDPEVQKVFEYVQSDAFRELVMKVESINDVINFYDYLAESGLDIYGLVNQMHAVIGLPPLKPRYFDRSAKITGGISGLIKDVKAILPIVDIKALYHEKLESSTAFADLVKRLQSPQFQELINRLRANEEFKKILQFGIDHGVDVAAIRDLLNTIFGLEFPDNRNARSTQELHDDLDDFLALVPMDEVKEIAFDYLENDAQVQEAVEYLESSAFHQIVEEVEAMKEAKDVLKYLQDSGLDAYGFLNKIHDLLGIPQFHPSSRINRATGGMPGLIADIKALLPIEKIKAMYYEKLEKSPAFANLIKRLGASEFQDFVDAVLEKEEARVIINKLKAHGVDLQAIADLVSTILGLHFPTPESRMARNSLHDDLNDFLALVPIDEVTEIALNYLENDAQVEEAVEYLESSAFRQIVEEVEAMKEAHDVLKYLQDSGLDAYGFLNKIHDLLGIPQFHPSGRISRVSGGIPGMIADIKALLPIEKIEALYHEKLETSPAFANLIKRLGAPEFQDFVDAVLEKKEARVIIDKLNSHGVDLKAIADLITTILGLHFPNQPTLVRANNELMEDLKDFLALVPTSDVLDIAVDYIFNDADVQKAAIYVMTNDFKELATAAEQNNEFRNFVNYLDESGLPAAEYLNEVNSFLNLPELVPSKLIRSLRSGGGVRGMLDSIEAALPKEEIEVLYELKMKNSPAFKRLVDRLSSEDFQDIVNDLAANVDFQNLGYEAEKFGIDLDAIVDFFAKVFGITIPKIPRPNLRFPREVRSLEDDLKEFVALLPMKRIRGIVVKYVLTDKEVKDAVVYIRSPAFAELIKDLHKIPEYHDLLESLEASGLNVYSYIEKIHKLFGIKGMLSKKLRTEGGISGLVAEVKATLPIDQIKALYHKKLDNSEDFAGLVNLISSAKFQALTDKLFANKNFQDVLHRLQGHGINLQIISDFFLTIFGIKTPPGIIDHFLM